MEMFTEATGIKLEGKDLEYGKIVYEAEGKMLEDQKRTKPTMQNYGIYVDRMDGKLGHSTIKNRPFLCAFTEYLIGLRQGEKKPESTSEIQRLKAENSDLNKILTRQTIKIVSCDAVMMDYVKICHQNQQQKALIDKLKEVIRMQGIDPYTIVPSETVFNRYRSVGSGTYVDIQTGEVLTEEDYEKRKLEEGFNPDIDEQ